MTTILFVAAIVAAVISIGHRRWRRVRLRRAARRRFGASADLAILVRSYTEIDGHLSGRWCHCAALILSDLSATRPQEAVTQDEVRRVIQALALYSKHLKGLVKWQSSQHRAYTTARPVSSGTEERARDSSVERDAGNSAEHQPPLRPEAPNPTDSASHTAIRRPGSARAR